MSFPIHFDSTDHALGVSNFAGNVAVLDVTSLALSSESPASTAGSGNRVGGTGTSRAEAGATASEAHPIHKLKYLGQQQEQDTSLGKQSVAVHSPCKAQSAGGLCGCATDCTRR
jgi:hypothetical protein